MRSCWLMHVSTKDNSVAEMASIMELLKVVNPLWEDGWEP